ncbi:MAG: DUF4062 domain-containing protein, partial [Candidatus Tectomicrobia bacterium]
MATIYLSSTYSDLQEYREAVYRALRQMRHDVIAMEDYVATDERPADKCLTDVAACEVYIGLFAWRYGYIPATENPEQRSITEMEYREAGTQNRPRLIFLLDDKAPWSPQLMDAVTGDGDNGARIKALRQELTQEKLVSFFTTPDDLAKLVSIAIGRLEVKQGQPQSALLEASNPLREAYLGWLIDQVRAVRLTGVDPKSVREENR